jgi:hypothetical protein
VAAELIEATSRITWWLTDRAGCNRAGTSRGQPEDKGATERDRQWQKPDDNDISLEDHPASSCTSWSSIIATLRLAGADSASALEMEIVPRGGDRPVP